MPKIEGITCEYMYVELKPDLPAVRTLNGSSIVVRAMAFDPFVLVVVLDTALWEHQIVHQTVLDLVGAAKKKWLEYMNAKYPTEDNATKLAALKGFHFATRFPDHISATISITTC